MQLDIKNERFAIDYVKVVLIVTPCLLPFLQFKFFTLGGLEINPSMFLTLMMLAVYVSTIRSFTPISALIFFVLLAYPIGISISPDTNFVEFLKSYIQYTVLVGATVGCTVVALPNRRVFDISIRLFAITSATLALLTLAQSIAP